jgi:FdhD protein
MVRAACGGKMANMKTSKPGLRAPSVAPVRVVTLQGRRQTRRRTDQLAIEEPLEIRVRGRSVAVTMRTPGHDRELAAGFLVSERILTDRRQLVDIRICPASLEPENTLDVFLRSGVEVDFARLTRHVFAASSCGLCGKASIAAVKQRFPSVKSAQTVRAAVVRRLPARMKRAQEAFQKTGGLHAAGLFDWNGNLVVMREDVGRHNAVDKVLGHGFLEDRLPFDSHILLVSGRASFEIVQKALAAGVPIVCAVSAPSSLAVEFARESGQTLVGFLRGPRMNIYSHPERIRP